MFVLPLILAAGSLLSLISAAPTSNSLSDHAMRSITHGFIEHTYLRVYGGNGDVSDGWPSVEDWYPTFQDMFEANKHILQASCAQFNVPDNSEAEIKDISNSIQSVSRSTGVDPRFILAIVLQESNGCVRVPTTDYGVVNPGLMQSHNGTGTCNRNRVVQDPCPASEIHQMIKDGTAGTASGPGLSQCIAQSGTSGVSKYYKAARIYNSGTIAASGNLGAGIATHCYVSDVANRLIGWNYGTSLCNPDTIGELNHAFGVTTGSSATSTNATAAVSTSFVTAAAKPTTTASEGPISQPIAKPNTLSGGFNASHTLPIYPYAIRTCQKYYTVGAGEDCILLDDRFGITMSQLMSWNPGLDDACTNLWLGYQYCVKANSDTAGNTGNLPDLSDPSPSANVSGGSHATSHTESPASVTATITTSTTSKPTASGASPTYPYAIRTCQKYYTVSAGDDCILLDDRFGITMSQLMSWNPGLNDVCTNLWQGYQYCVAA